MRRTRYSPGSRLGEPPPLVRVLRAPVHNHIGPALDPRLAQIERIVGVLVEQCVAVVAGVVAQLPGRFRPLGASSVVEVPDWTLGGGQIVVDVCLGRDAVRAVWKDLGGQ